MRSPDAIVKSRLSSKTEFKASIHSGSMSPSQMIQELISAYKSKLELIEVGLVTI